MYTANVEHVVFRTCPQLNRTCSITYMYMYTANVEHVVFRTCTHQIEHVVLLAQVNRTCTCTCTQLM